MCEIELQSWTKNVRKSDGNRQDLSACLRCEHEASRYTKLRLSPVGTCRIASNCLGTKCVAVHPTPLEQIILSLANRMRGNTLDRHASPQAFYVTFSADSELMPALFTTYAIFHGAEMPIALGASWLGVH